MSKKIIMLMLVLSLACSAPAYGGLFENKKIVEALAGDSLKVGMSKESLVAAIGYPPDGAAKQGAMFYRFAQSKVTGGGKEESWTYQLGATAEGVRSVTFKLVDSKVSEWSEWLNSKK